MTQRLDIAPLEPAPAGGPEVVREPLERASDLRPHHHVCMLYDDPAEAEPFLAEFFRAGLARNERGVYIADEHRPEEVAAFLARGGVDVDRATKEGRLAVVTKRDTYLRNGSFDPEGMMGIVRTTLDQARQDGMAGCVVAGEMTWALGPEVGVERVVEYEAMVNHIFRDSDLVAICAYNARRFPPRQLIEIMETHPLVVVGNRICRNPYYVPPEEVLGGRRDEQALRRLVENLVAREAQERERVAARERQRELERLREQEQALRDFVGAAAHELGNPLTPLSIQAGLLQTRHAEGLTPKQREAVQVMERSIQRLTALVQDLLEVSRFQAGRVTLEPGPLDVHSVVVETLEALQESADRGRVGVQTHTRPGLAAHADGRRLAQVMYNLVGNAVKFTPEGGRVEVTAERTREGLVVRVRDTGPGIPQEVRARLFQPFTRFGSVGVPGTGLGLFVCKQVMELHGGRIWYEDPGRGGGACFAFLLPASPRAGAAGLPPAASQAQAGARP